MISMIFISFLISQSLIIMMIKAKLENSIDINGKIYTKVLSTLLNKI